MKYFFSATYKDIGPWQFKLKRATILRAETGEYIELNKITEETKALVRGFIGSNCAAFTWNDNYEYIAVCQAIGPTEYIYSHWPTAAVVVRDMYKDEFWNLPGKQKEKHRGRPDFTVWTKEAHDLGLRHLRSKHRRRL